MSRAPPPGFEPLYISLLCFTKGSLCFTHGPFCLVKELHCSTKEPLCFTKSGEDYVLRASARFQASYALQSIYSLDRRVVLPCRRAIWLYNGPFCFTQGPFFLVKEPFCFENRPFCLTHWPFCPDQGPFCFTNEPIFSTQSGEQDVHPLSSEYRTDKTVKARLWP